MALCGFCGREASLVKKKTEKLVEYRCSECGAPLEVYLPEMEERLRKMQADSPTAKK